MFVLVLVACAPSTPTQAPATMPIISTQVPPAASTALKGDIVLLLNEAPENIAGYQQIIDAFAKVQPGVKVTTRTDSF